jgi:hypothetical protein
MGAPYLERIKAAIGFARIAIGSNINGVLLGDELACEFYYDSNVYDGDFLRHLVRYTAPNRAFLGTDYPCALMQTAPGDYLWDSGLTTDELQSACFAAAAHFLV